MSESISSPHNTNYVVFFFLHDQAQAFDLSAMLGSGGHDIDSCGVDAAMAQNIRQLRNILLDPIKSPGKELAQVMGENLGRIHICSMTQPFHLRPNVTAIHRLSALCNEYGSAADSSSSGIIQ